MLTYLAKLGELTLKGSNLHDFETLLARNTRKCLSGTDSKVILHAGRMYIECDEKDCEKVEFTLNHILGITGWAKAETCEKSIEAIKATVYQIAERLAAKGCKTFKIQAKRAEKNFPMNSYEICCEAAGDVEKLMKVDVHKPDCVIYVEVREKVFCLFGRKRWLPWTSCGFQRKGPFAFERRS